MKKSQPTETTANEKELSKMCNLTPRRLRQLAEQRRIPTPSKGQWPLEQTIRDLFRYYQTSGEEYSRERTMKLAAQRRREELKFDLERKKYVLTCDVSAAILRVCQCSRDKLYEKLLNEYPSRVCGMDVPSIRTESSKIFDEICQSMQQLGDEFDNVRTPDPTEHQQVAKS